MEIKIHIGFAQTLVRAFGKEIPLYISDKRLKYFSLANKFWDSLENCEKESFVSLLSSEDRANVKIALQMCGINNAEICDDFKEFFLKCNNIKKIHNILESLGYEKIFINSVCNDNVNINHCETSLFCIQIWLDTTYMDFNNYKDFVVVCECGGMKLLVNIRLRDLNDHKSKDDLLDKIKRLKKLGKVSIPLEMESELKTILEHYLGIFD